jgi:hypothetical protein
VRILDDPQLRARMERFQEGLADSVKEKDENVRKQFE